MKQMVKIRVFRAMLLSATQASVIWKDEERKHGRDSYTHARTFTKGWGLRLAQLIATDSDLWNESVQETLDVRGTLTGDPFDPDFNPDPSHEGHTRCLLVKSVMSE